MLTPSRQSLIDWAMIHSPAAAVELWNRHDDAAYVERWMKVIDMRQKNRVSPQSASEIEAARQHALAGTLIAGEWLDAAEVLKLEPHDGSRKDPADAIAVGTRLAPPRRDAPPARVALPAARAVVRGAGGRRRPGEGEREKTVPEKAGTGGVTRGMFEVEKQ